MRKIYTLAALLMCFSILNAQKVKVTFRVSMKGLTVDASGVYVMGDFQNWNPAGNKLTLINGTMGVYAGTFDISVPSSGTKLTYKFLNGSSGSKVENTGLGVGTCGTSNGLGGFNRLNSVPGGMTAITLPAFKYNSCDSVANVTSVPELTTAENAFIAPNPSYEKTHVFFDNPTQALHTIEVINIAGQVVQKLAATRLEQVDIETAKLSKGVYLARIRNAEGASKTLTFVVQ
jgi:Secretion system C-terminal sorting domain